MREGKPSLRVLRRLLLKLAVAKSGLVVTMVEDSNGLKNAIGPHERELIRMFPSMK